MNARSWMPWRTINETLIFEMLTWFRKKRKAIIPLVGGVFLAGLFSYFCPHCLAKMLIEENAAVSNANTYEHCSSMTASRQGAKHSGNHCNGTCGCGGHAMLIGTRHLVTMSDSKGYPHIRMPVLNDSSAPDLRAIYLSYIIGRPYKPDRACFSPLERNCVLLN